jgi:hypothetical protein
LYRLGAAHAADYRELLRRQTLLPGRRMLQERIDERFRALEAQGISTVAGLKASCPRPQSLLRSPV